MYCVYEEIKTKLKLQPVFRSGAESKENAEIRENRNCVINRPTKRINTKPSNTTRKPRMLCSINALDLFVGGTWFEF
jgi:hypothetical protein